MSLKLLLPSIIINKLNRRFSIREDESLANLKAIDIPPILMHTPIEMDSIEKKLRNEDLIYFYNTITNAFKNYDLSYMYENLKSLKIYPIYVKNPKFLKRNVAAYYNCIKNVVRYTKNVKDKVLPHELLHMASTVKRYEDESIFSGFSQSTKLGNYELFAKGINEGYTQFLTERYFRVNYRSYPLEVLIASKLENIIGKSTMERMYFEADLKGLTDELLKYMDEKSIIMFFYAVDFLGTTYSKTDITEDLSWLKKAYYYVVEFLMNVKTQKIKEEETNLKSAKRELKDFSESLKYKIVDKKNNKDIILLDEFVLQSMINKYIKELKDFYIFNSLKHI